MPGRRGNGRRGGGGASICKHNRVRGKCKDCGGASICEHNRRRSACKDCGGAGICEHNRERRHCRDCGGEGLINKPSNHIDSCLHSLRRFLAP